MVAMFLTQFDSSNLYTRVNNQSRLPLDFRHRSLLTKTHQECEQLYLELMSQSNQFYYNPVSNTMPIRLLILVGLPGSGKSVLAQQLTDAHIFRMNRMWCRVCLDELDELDECDVLVSFYLQNTTHPVVLDMCNLTIDERRHWLHLNQLSPHQCACIYFDTGSIEVYIQRLQNRDGLDTSLDMEEPDSYIEQLVSNYANLIEPPKVEEGFSWVKTINNFSELNVIINYLLDTDQN